VKSVKSVAFLLLEELYTVLRNEAGEMLEGTVIGSLGLRRKTASRKLPAAQMISQALAAGVFLRTRFIRAITVFLVLFLHALHRTILLIPKSAIYL
jgi:hypothetical protein